jgi:uncharacterized RDD family membrane protein YckC
MSKQNSKPASKSEVNNEQAINPYPPKFTYPNAGFWRRIFAFLIDMLILGIPAGVLGWVLMPWVNKFGNASQLLGFLFVLPYFGIMNSRLSKGQTIGKALFNLSVRRSNGEYLTPLQSVLRTFTLFSYMFFIGMTALFPAAPVVKNALTAVAYGLMVGLILLFLINKETRQTWHDLLFDTRVLDLRKKTKDKPAKMAKHSWIIALAFALITIGGQFLAANQSGSQVLDPTLTEISQQMAQQYDLSNITFATRSMQVNSNGETKTSNTLMVRAYAIGKMNKDQIADLSSQISTEIQNQYPEISQYETIIVTVYSGFNLGFVSFSNTSGQTFTINK